MWHKLMEIFGFRERQWSPQPSISNNETDRMPPEGKNDGAKLTSRDEGKSNKSNITQNSTENTHKKSEGEKPAIKNTSVFKTSFELPSFGTKTDSNKGECVGCKATASFLSLGIILNIWRTMWKRRGEMAPDIQKAVAVMNISLLGMWLTFMEKEWLRPKDVKTINKHNEVDTTVTADNVKSNV